MKYSNRFYDIYEDSGKYSFFLKKDALGEMDKETFELFLNCVSAAHRDLFE